MEHHYTKDWPPVRIVCAYCSIERKYPEPPVAELDGLKSIHAYAEHYADMHMSVHGMVSVGDVIRQTRRWEIYHDQEESRRQHALGYFLPTINVRSRQQFGNMLD